MTFDADFLGYIASKTPAAATVSGRSGVPGFLVETTTVGDLEALRVLPQGDKMREEFRVVWRREGWTRSTWRAFAKRETAEHFVWVLRQPLTPTPLDEPPDPEYAKWDPSTLLFVRIDVRLVGPWHKGDDLNEQGVEHWAGWIR